MSDKISSIDEEAYIEKIVKLKVDLEKRDDRRLLYRQTFRIIAVTAVTWVAPMTMFGVWAWAGTLQGIALFELINKAWLWPALWFVVGAFCLLIFCQSSGETKSCAN